MSGEIAAARAFIKAGNYPLAQTLINAALAADPTDGTAHDAMCDLYREQNDFTKLEGAAKAWIAVEPRNWRAYFQLCGSYAARKDGPKAHATLDQVHYLWPELGPLHEALAGMIAANCNSSYDRIVALSQAAGNQQQEWRWASQASYTKSDFVEAVRLGELAWEAGETSESFGSYLAMICFRSFRFGKARKYASLTIEGLAAHPAENVHRPKCRELLLLTRVVWFPPILLAHAILFGLAHLNCERSYGAKVGSIALLISGVLLTAIMAAIQATFDLPMPYGLVAFVIGLMTAYCLYFPHIGKAAELTLRKAKHGIRISNY